MILQIELLRQSIENGREAGRRANVDRVRNLVIEVGIVLAATERGIEAGIAVASDAVVDLVRQGTTGTVDDDRLRGGMIETDDGIEVMIRAAAEIEILEEPVLRALTVRLRFSEARGFHAA